MKGGVDTSQNDSIPFLDLKCLSTTSFLTINLKECAL